MPIPSSRGRRDDGREPIGIVPSGDELEPRILRALGHPAPDHSRAVHHHCIGHVGNLIWVIWVI